MTKEELLTALRAAPGPSQELDAEITAVINNCIVKPYPPTDDFGPRNKWQFWSSDGKHFLGSEAKFKVEPLTSSVDAAAAFRERELPGWDYANGNNSVPWAWVRKSLGEHIFLERCATECLSIVAAVVAGVIAKEGET
jgi:hypothetical protein